MDVQALIEADTDLADAIRDAPRKDAGFSAMTLAWVLHSFDTRPLARASSCPVVDAEPERLATNTSGAAQALIRSVAFSRVLQCGSRQAP